MARGVHFIVVFNHIPALIAEVEAVSKGAPKKVADRMAATARELVAVDTGYLRSTIESVSVARGKTAEVQVNASYAAPQEYGTWKMAAHPFLTPAFEAHQEELGLAIMAPLLGKSGFDL